MTSANNSLVLVTGASGYIGIHCVKTLLDRGYRVRGTVRSVDNKKKVKPIQDLDEGTGRLELVEADLLKEDGWKSAVSGCDYVLHVASPYPTHTKVYTDDQIVKPAVEGTINVLKECSKCPSVKRVVLTSSIVAMYVGNYDKTVDDTCWSDLKAPDLTTYEKSKTIAEKAAWDFVNNIQDPNNKFELVAINPAMVTGPMLHDVEGTSAEIVKQFMLKQMPVVPHVSIGVIDVRDVAAAHVNAIEIPEAAGQRFLMANPKTSWMTDIGQYLSAEFKPQGYNIPTMKAPKFALCVARLWDNQVRAIYPRVDDELTVDVTKMRRILGIKEPYTAKQSLIDMAYSMIERGFLPKKPQYKGPPEK